MKNSQTIFLKKCNFLCNLQLSIVMTHTGNVKIAPNVGKESLDKRCLYIKNVSPTITQEDLSAIFTPFGAINVDLKRREEGGLGVAFVNFDDEIKADVA